MKSRVKSRVKELSSPPIAPIKWACEVRTPKFTIRTSFVSRTAFDAREQAAVKYGVTRSDVTVLPMGQRWQAGEGL